MRAHVWAPCGALLAVRAAWALSVPASAALRRLSEAHVGAFERDGRVLLRSVAGAEDVSGVAARPGFPPLEEVAHADEALAFGAPAALACRLLGAPRVLFLYGELLAAEAPLTSAPVVEGTGRRATLCVALRESASLLPGDAVAVDPARREPRSCLGGEAAAFLALHYATEDGPPQGAPLAGHARFPVAWEDPLFGKRGRAPVSVVEWSKGIAVAEERSDFAADDARDADGQGRR